MVRNQLVKRDAGSLRPQATGKLMEENAGLIFRSIGYHGNPLADVPFDHNSGTIPNECGQIIDEDQDKSLRTREYVAGWIKRGPTGVIGTNKQDAVETVHRMLETFLQEKIEANKDLAQFKPIILEEDLNYEKAMFLETYQDDFPGVSIVIRPRRFYPHQNLASHLIGYVGIVQEDWTELPEEKRSSSQIVGHSGVELLLNDHMIGLDGGRQAEVDHMGRELQILGDPVPSVPGKNIYLNLDVRLQNVADEAMSGQSGAVLIMNPKTGRKVSIYFPLLLP